MGKWWVIFHSARRPGVRPRRTLPRGKGHFRLCYAVWRFHLDFQFGRGIWVTRREPWTERDVLAAGPVLVREKPVMKKRGVKPLGEATKHLAPMESDVFSKLLPLVEHCAVRQYDDGETREPGWFTVKTQGAAWSVQIKDPDSCCSFTAVGKTLDEALETAALLLGCEEAPWEPDTFLQASAARKKKK